MLRNTDLVPFPHVDLEHHPALFELAIRALAEGHSIRATARIIQVDQDTVGTWLDRAAQHCRLVIRYLWQQLPVRECQLDELWSVVHTTKELHYAQVVKTRERGRVVAVDHHVVFGDAPRIAALLAVLPASATINTSFGERENLALVQHNRRLMRRTKACSTELPWLEKQLWLSLAYTHVVLPHHSLGQELPMVEPTRPATHF